MVANNDRIIDQFGQVRSLTENSEPVKIGSPTIRKQVNQTEQALREIGIFPVEEKPAVQQAAPQPAAQAVQPEGSRTAAQALTALSKQASLAQQLTSKPQTPAVEKKPAVQQQSSQPRKPADESAEPKQQKAEETPGYKIVKVPVYDEKGQLISYQQVRRAIEEEKEKTETYQLVRVPVYDTDGNVVGYQMVNRPVSAKKEKPTVTGDTRYRNPGTIATKKETGQKAQPKPTAEARTQEAKPAEKPQSEKKPPVAAQPAPAVKPKPQAAVKPPVQPAAEQSAEKPAASPQPAKTVSEPAPKTGQPAHTQVSVSAQPAEMKPPVKPAQPALRPVPAVNKMPAAAKPKAAEDSQDKLKWYFKLVLVLDVLCILLVAALYLPFSPLRKNLIISSLSQKEKYYIAYGLYTDRMIQETVNDYLNIDE